MRRLIRTSLPTKQPAESCCWMDILEKGKCRRAEIRSGWKLQRTHQRMQEYQARDQHWQPSTSVSYPCLSDR